MRKKFGVPGKLTDDCSDPTAPFKKRIKFGIDVVQGKRSGFCGGIAIDLYFGKKVPAARCLPTEATCWGMRVPKEQLIAAAMRVWDQAVIEAALGDDAATVLPKAIRLMLLRVRIPRYQGDMLVALATQHETTVDDMLTRELEDVACAHAEELAAVMLPLSAALAWPRQA